MIAIKNSRMGDTYVERELVTRMTIKSLVTDTELMNFDIGSLIEFDESLNPEIYTLEEVYMTEYLNSKINSLFGISYDEFINLPLTRARTLLRLGLKEAKTMNNQVSNLITQVEGLNNGL